MNFKESKEWEGVDRELDDLLERSMEIKVPEDLIHRTMERLPEIRAVPYPWWAWAVYVGFFAVTVIGLAYWEWQPLVSQLTNAALVVSKTVILAAQFPYVTLAVAGAFLMNASLMWFIAAELVIRKRLTGVVS